MLRKVDYYLFFSMFIKFVNIVILILSDFLLVYWDDG